MKIARRIDFRLATAPAALSRLEAAWLVGLSATTFDKMVLAGVMPQPRVYPETRRHVWLLHELEAALEDLPVHRSLPVDPYDGVRL